MKRPFVQRALDSILSMGRALVSEEILQLLPSPTGAYQAILVKYQDSKGERTSVLKVLRAGEPLAPWTKALRELPLPADARPHLAWMSDDTLVIDAPDGKPTRAPLQGEVNVVFSPWRVMIATSTEPPMRRALRDLSNLISREPPSNPRPLIVTQPDIRKGSSSEQERIPDGGAPVAPAPKMPPIVGDLNGRFPGLTLPEDFVVLAGGGASSARSSEFAIDQSGHTTLLVNVNVDHPSKPVVLMLGAYEPTVWTIQHSPETTLLAVLASGYHRQVVTGLDASIPVTIHTSENGSPWGYVVVDAKHLEKLNPMAVKFFGREVDRVHLARQGELHMGTESKGNSRWISRGDAPLETYIDKSAPLAGEAGLDDGVRKGLMRRANLGDLKQWGEAMDKMRASIGLPPDKDRSPAHVMHASFTLSRSYVVLKPMTYPAGLYGSSSAVFFIPKGVERPRGNPGHSTVHDFNDMSSIE